MSLTTSAAITSKSVNWEILSVVRFLLAFIVIVEHLNEFADVSYLKWYEALGSFEAILGFLLISGFSIGTSIAKNSTNYFKRRMQRIYPVYIASIVFQIVVVGIDFSLISILLVIVNLLFLNQILTATSLLGPAWTLAAEVWLYSLAPIFLRLDKKKLLYLIIFSFACFALYTCGRTLFNWPYYAGLPYGINLFLLGFIWIAGFRLAVFPESKKENAIIIGLILLGYLGLIMAIQTAFRIKHNESGLLLSADVPQFIGKTICVAIAYYTVVFNFKIPTLRPAIHKVFNFLGNISYPLYLSHITTYKLLKRFNVTGTAFYILAAVAMSAIIYYIFDFYSKKRK